MSNGQHFQPGSPYDKFYGQQPNPQLRTQRQTRAAGSARPQAGAAASYALDDTAPQPRVPRVLRRSSADQTPSVPYGASAPGQGYPPAANPSAVPSYHGGPAIYPSQPRRRRGPRFAPLAALLWLLLLPSYGLLALRALPTDLASGMLVPELVSFVPWVIPVAALCLIGALVCRRWVLTLFSAVALAVCVSWHWGYFVPQALVSDAARAAVTQADASDSAARIMTLNAYNGHADATQIVNLVAQNHIEVLCLEEVTTDLVNELEAAGISNYLPYHVVSDAASQISNGGRNGIWTLAPQSNVSGNLLSINTSSMPAANITLGGTTVRVVAVHPNSPIRGAEAEWAAGLSVISQLNDYDHAYLVMGDFNSTLDHARFRELLGTRFADTSASSGQLFHPTYPASDVVPPLIEIDHILYSKNAGIVVSDLTTLRVSGTDHLALIGTLEASS